MQHILFSYLTDRLMNLALLNPGPRQKERKPSQTDRQTDRQTDQKITEKEKSETVSGQSRLLQRPIDRLLTRWSINNRRTGSRWPIQFQVDALLDANVHVAESIRLFKSWNLYSNPFPRPLLKKKRRKIHTPSLMSELRDQKNQIQT